MELEFNWGNSRNLRNFRNLREFREIQEAKTDGERFLGLQYIFPEEYEE